MPARIGNVAFDCDDVLKVAAFWSKALGRSIDDGSSELFATIGGGDPDRAEPALYFNKVPETKHAKNRVHLDLVDPDTTAVEKLLGIGATVVARHRIAGQSWTVMHDLEGNEFCVATKSYTG
ncbi:MAG: VOC family protein [Jatrophihabitantaceae bacterium]